VEAVVERISRGFFCSSGHMSAVALSVFFISVANASVGGHFAFRCVTLGTSVSLLIDGDHFAFGNFCKLAH
jgi:hypothetical protein